MAGTEFMLTSVFNFAGLYIQTSRQLQVPESIDLELRLARLTVLLSNRNRLIETKQTDSVGKWTSHLHAPCSSREYHEFDGWGAISESDLHKNRLYYCTHFGAIVSNASSGYGVMRSLSMAARFQDFIHVSLSAAKLTRKELQSEWIDLALDLMIHVSCRPAHPMHKEVAYMYLANQLILCYQSWVELTLCYGVDIQESFASIFNGFNQAMEACFPSPQQLEEFQRRKTVVCRTILQFTSQLQTSPRIFQLEYWNELLQLSLFMPKLHRYIRLLSENLMRKPDMALV